MPSQFFDFNVAQMAKLYKYKCRLSNCNNKYVPSSSENKHFFSFPTNDKKRNKWFESINDLSEQKIEFSSAKMYLCEDHFTKNCFSNSSHNRLTKFGILQFLINFQI